MNPVIFKSLKAHEKYVEFLILCPIINKKL